MALLVDVRTKLNILSSDEQTDNKIVQIIASAKSHLRRFHPGLTTEDFEDDRNPAKSLLLNYCLYDYSNAADQFDADYKRELLDLRHIYEVSTYAPEE